MDLLGSILNAMDKQAPPALSEQERMRRKKQKEKLEQQKEQGRKEVNVFRNKMEKCINDFVKDVNSTQYVCKPMDKIWRSIIHDIAEVAGLPSFSFGEEGENRHVVVYKKESAPTDRELLEMKRLQTADVKVAREQILKREEEDQLEKEANKNQPDVSFKPACNYKEKYEHLIGKESAIDAAKRTITNKQYGFVPSENKKDQRSIEQTLADLRARKKQKLTHETSDHKDGEEPKPNTA